MKHDVLERTNLPVKCSEQKDNGPYELEIWICRTAGAEGVNCQGNAVEDGAHVLGNGYNNSSHHSSESKIHATTGCSLDGEIRNRLFHHSFFVLFMKCPQP